MALHSIEENSTKKSIPSILRQNFNKDDQLILQYNGVTDTNTTVRDGVRILLQKLQCHPNVNILDIIKKLSIEIPIVNDILDEVIVDVQGLSLNALENNNDSILNSENISKSSDNVSSKDTIENNSIPKSHRLLYIECILGFILYHGQLNKTLPKIITTIENIIDTITKFHQHAIWEARNEMQQEQKVQMIPNEQTIEQCLIWRQLLDCCHNKGVPGYRNEKDCLHLQKLYSNIDTIIPSISTIFQLIVTIYSYTLGDDKSSYTEPSEDNIFLLQRLLQMCVHIDNKISIASDIARLQNSLQVLISDEYFPHSIAKLALAVLRITMPQDDYKCLSASQADEGIMVGDVLGYVDILI